LATFSLEKGFAEQGKQKYLLHEQVKANITPSCKPKSPDCEQVTMTTNTERNVTVTAIANEKLRVSSTEAPLLKGFIDVFLGSGTRLKLGESGVLGENILMAGVTNVLYSINLSVISDPLTGLQQLKANFFGGTGNSYFSSSFNADSAMIQDRVINAFTYDSNLDEWFVGSDTLLFSLGLTSSQSFSLVSADSATDPGTEGLTSVPEPSTALGSLALFGVGGFFKRKRMLKIESKRETT
jgi:hypothetical protein